MCMSCSALFALKRAIEAARQELGVNNFFPLGKCYTELQIRGVTGIIKHISPYKHIL